MLSFGALGIHSSPKSSFIGQLKIVSWDSWNKLAIPLATLSASQLLVMWENPYSAIQNSSMG